MMLRGRLVSRAARPVRRGAALVECAILLSFLSFLFLVTVDYCRLFYYAVTLENAAYAGALYGSRDTTHSSDTTGIEAAALADTSDVSPAPTVTSTPGTDSNGDTTLTVTVTYTFSTLGSYLGIPHQTTISGKATMRVLP
jgi:Flp pilus assembly protein TadG